MATIIKLLGHTLVEMTVRSGCGAPAPDPSHWRRRLGASPSPVVRLGSSIEPARQEILLDDQLPERGVEVANLTLVVPRPPLRAHRGQLRQILDRLALPRPHVVRMNPGRETVS